MADAREEPRTTTSAGEDTPEVRVYDNKSTTGVGMTAGTSSGMTTRETSTAPAGTNWTNIILGILVVLVIVLLIWWLL